ncbi:MAG: hypothetical protein ACYTG4_16780, partial [Planctomycetota bacterium]
MSPARQTKGKPARKGPLNLKGFLQSKRVSELQEFHTFWAEETGKPPARKGDLLDSLSTMIRDSSRVGDRVKLLAEKPLMVLHLLVRKDDYSSDLAGLVRAADGARVEGYELEAAARALGRRGFLEVSREQNGRPVRREVYALPRELAETVSLLLMEDKRGAREVFTLEGHIHSLGAGARARLARHCGLNGDHEGSSPADLAEAILAQREAGELFDAAPDDSVRTLLERAAILCGGVVARSRFKKDLGTPLR